MEPKYFVYVKHNGKIEPQIWIGEKMKGETGKPYPTLFRQELKEDELSLTLYELVGKYPNKVNDDNNKSSNQKVKG